MTKKIKYRPTKKVFNKIVKFLQSDIVKTVLTIALCVILIVYIIA